MTDALRECVHETRPGNRLAAVDTLFKELPPYAEMNPYGFADIYEKEVSSGLYEDENSEGNRTEM